MQSKSLPNFWVVVTSLDDINDRSIQTLLRGENDSKQSDKIQVNPKHTGRALYPLELLKTHGERGHILGSHLTCTFCSTFLYSHCTPTTTWIKQIDNNFPGSVLLSTTEITSRCSKLKCNYKPQACGYTAKFWTFNSISITTLAVNGHFRWSFLENRAREKEKNKLCHLPVTSIVCMVWYIDSDQSARKESFSYGKMPNFIFYGPCVHTTTDVSVSLKTWIFFLRIQVEESFPVALDKVSELA